MIKTDKKTSTQTNIDLTPLILCGRDAMRLKDWTVANEYWQQVAHLDPGYFESWYCLAQLSLNLGRFKDAIEQAEKARLIHPEHTGNLTSLARAYQRLGLAKEAVNVWEIILGLTVGNYEAHYRLGVCYKILNQLELAENNFTLAQNIKPKDIHAHLYRVEVLSQLGRSEDAIQYWIAFIENSLNDIGVRKKYAIFLLKQKRHADAESVLVDILRELPDELEAASLLLKLFVNTKRWKDIIELLEPFFKEVRTDIKGSILEMLQQFARALAMMGRTADAEHQYREVLKIQPDNTLILAQLGCLLREMGRQRDAIDFFRQACELEPEELTHWQGMITALLAIDCHIEVREVLFFAEKAVPHLPSNLLKLGRICESALMFDDALRFLKLAADADPSLAKHVGLFSATYGFFSEALCYLSKAKENEPSSVEIAEALISQLEILRLLGLKSNLNIDALVNRDLLLPELLYERMVEDLLARNQFYEFVPGRVILIGSSLAAGGAERQLSITARLLGCNKSKIESVTLILESLNSQDKKDFYLENISEFSIEIVTSEVLSRQPDLFSLDESIIGFIKSFPSPQRESIINYYKAFLVRRPEAVHSWQDSINLNAVVAAVLAGVPNIILSTRSTRPDNPRRRLKRYMRRGYMAVMRLPNVIMLNNSQAGARDYEDWLELPPETIKVIYNGLDLDHLSHVSVEKDFKKNRDLHNIPLNASVIGGVFRMSEEKRPLLWLETAALIAKNIPSAHFIVAGDGPMRMDMHSYVKKLGIEDRVHFLGQVNLTSWLQVINVLFLTSRTEGLSNVLIEAQLFGIPVVAPDVGGCIEAVEQGVTGWIIESATASTLAEKVTYVLQDHIWSEQAKVAAPRYVKKKFNADLMIDKTIDAYCLGKRSNLIGQLERQPYNKDVIRAMAFEAYYNNSNYKELLLQVISMIPDDVDINLILGKIFFLEMKYDISVNNFKMVVSIDRNHIEGWRYLGRTQEKLMEFDDALASWNKILTLIPADFEGLCRVGQLLVRNGKIDLAKHSFKKAYDLNSVHPKINQLLAHINLKQGCYNFALIYYTRFLLFKLKYLFLNKSDFCK